MQQLFVRMSIQLMLHVLSGTVVRLRSSFITDLSVLAVIAAESALANHSRRRLNNGV